MIHQHLREYVIRPVLSELKTSFDIGDDMAAEALLVLTAATESHGGKWLHQVGGPACGIYQMEPATIKYVVGRIMDMPLRTVALPRCLKAGLSAPTWDEAVCGDLRFATALARFHYWFVPEPLPLFGDREGLARYWKQYWNTEGDIHTAIDDYRQYMKGTL